MHSRCARNCASHPLAIPRLFPETQTQHRLKDLTSRRHTARDRDGTEHLTLRRHTAWDREDSELTAVAQLSLRREISPKSFRSSPGEDATRRCTPGRDVRPLASFIMRICASLLLIRSLHGMQTQVSPHGSTRQAVATEEEAGQGRQGASDPRERDAGLPSGMARHLTLLPCTSTATTDTSPPQKKGAPGVSKSLATRSCSAVIVYVFPEPVWPNMRHVADPPSATSRRSGTTVAW